MSGETEDSPQNLKPPDQSDGGQSQPSGVVPPVPPEAQQQLQQATQAMQKIMSTNLQMGMGFSATPVAHPLLAKIEPQHISKILDITLNHDKREFDTNQRSQLFIFILLFLTLGLIVLLIVIFKHKPEVLSPLLAGLGGLGSGFAAGFGFGRSQAK